MNISSADLGQNVNQELTWQLFCTYPAFIYNLVRFLCPQRSENLLKSDRVIKRHIKHDTHYTYSTWGLRLLSESEREFFSWSAKYTNLGSRSHSPNHSTISSFYFATFWLAEKYSSKQIYLETVKHAFNEW